MNQASLPEGSSIADVLARTRARNALALVAYPEEFKSWNVEGYDGVEVYNVYTNALKINAFAMFFDALWSYRSYPDLLFANFYTRPAGGLRSLGRCNSHDGQANGGNSWK